MSGGVRDESYLWFSLRYAFRNLWRNSRRTTLTISAVLFAVAVAIVFNRFSVAILKLWQDGAADTGSAHAQFHAVGYWQKQEGVHETLTLPENSLLEAQLRQDPAVTAMVRRLRLEGIISTVDDQSIYFVGLGVDPEGELAVSPRLFTKNDEGEFVSDERVSDIVVAKALAESLGLKVGDEATLITQTIGGSVNGIDVRVSGIVDAAIPSFSNRIVIAHIEHLQRLIRMPERYTELAVKVSEDTNLERWVDEKAEIAMKHGAEVRGWWDIEPLIKNVQKIWHSVVFAITILLFLSTALSVLNIIFMMVAERTVEIGTLMAIGARPVDVRRLFSLEAALIGVFGGLSGGIVGNLCVLVMNIFGVRFHSPFGNEQIIVHPEMNLGVTVVVFVCAVVICHLAALAPSRKAAMVEPVRAFRGQIT